MTTNVLLVGLKTTVIEQAQEQLQTPDVRFLFGTGLDDVRAALAATPIDHVIMGAGLDLQARLDIVREVFQRSETTSVHLKDRGSGPDGFIPFVRAVLGGFR